MSHYPWDHGDPDEDILTWNLETEEDAKDPELLAVLVGELRAVVREERKSYGDDHAALREECGRLAKRTQELAAQLEAAKWSPEAADWHAKYLTACERLQAKEQECETWKAKAWTAERKLVYSVHRETIEDLAKR